MLTCTPAQLASDRNIYPCVGLVVSGGHTSLYHCRDPIDLAYLGGTLMTQLVSVRQSGCHVATGIPGGPAVSNLRKVVTVKPLTSPRSLKRADNFDFSFSGLKTQLDMPSWARTSGLLEN